MIKSFQDQGSVLHCYGCGKDNSQGLKVKSFWNGDTATSTFLPKEFHCGGTKDIVYGGLLASLIDCHSCNFAIAYLYKSEAREIGSIPRIECVTAQLNISYHKPVKIGDEVNMVAKLKSHAGRKVWVRTELFSKDIMCTSGEVLAIRLP